MQPSTLCLKSHAVWGYVAKPLLYVEREKGRTRTNLSLGDRCGILYSPIARQMQGRGEHHIRTSVLAESGSLWRCLDLCVMGGRDSHVRMVPACSRAQPGLVGWRISAECRPPEPFGAAHQPFRVHKLFHCHRVILIIELPPPGNLSDLAPHIFISA